MSGNLVRQVAYISTCLTSDGSPGWSHKGSTPRRSAEAKAQRYLLFLTQTTECCFFQNQLSKLECTTPRVFTVYLRCLHFVKCRFILAFQNVAAFSYYWLFLYSSPWYMSWTFSRWEFIYFLFYFFICWNIRQDTEKKKDGTKHPGTPVVSMDVSVGNFCSPIKVCLMSECWHLTLCQSVTFLFKLIFSSHGLFRLSWLVCVAGRRKDTNAGLGTQKSKLKMAASFAGKTPHWIQEKNKQETRNMK